MAKPLRAQNFFDLFFSSQEALSLNFSNFIQKQLVLHIPLYIITYTSIYYYIYLYSPKAFGTVLAHFHTRSFLYAQALSSKKTHILKNSPKHRSVFSLLLLVLCAEFFTNITGLLRKLLCLNRFFVTTASQVCAERGSGILPVGISSADECRIAFRTSQKLFLMLRCHTKVTESSIGDAVVVEPVILRTPLSSERAFLRSLGSKLRPIIQRGPDRTNGLD